MNVERYKIWRVFISAPLLQALAIGLFAAVLAKGFWILAPITFTALDWALYDALVRHRAPIEASPSLAIIMRDPESEERFGSVLDRSVLAQLIFGVHEAGAAAIGLDHRLTHASASPGGAASDALLVEAMHAAGPLVFVHDGGGVFQSQSAIIGHVLVSTQSDHVTRQIPWRAIVEGQPVSAFGAVLYDRYRQQGPFTSPSANTTHTTAVIVNPVGDGSLSALPTTTLSSVWEAMQHQDKRRLEELFNGKVVVILPAQVPDGPWLLPTGQSVTGTVAHLHLLNNLLAGQQISRVGPWSGLGLTVLLASCIAWALLRFNGTASLLLSGSMLLLYMASAVALLSITSLILPIALPFTAAVFVIVGTITWGHVSARQRVLLLEKDMLQIQQDAAAVREALVLRENRVEALQEDLETAKAAVVQSLLQQEALTRSTASLRSQIADAQDQEQAVRLQLGQLERQLQGLRAASSDSRPLADTELNRLKEECRELHIITQHPMLLRMFRDLKKAAASPLTVLLLGEPGTGKELFARAVHRLSPRAHHALITVNMAAISPELFESEMFGHMKGSFSGANVDRRGYFELAHRGTIFLDEIGDLRLDHQSKLLRVLQERSFYRVGATVPTTVDVRIVAATNRDLQRGVSEGWFREDLYFRLKGFVFRLPPLCERPGDIPTLAEWALQEIAQRMGRPPLQLSNDAMGLLTTYRWPGNVRELRHVLERAAALSDGSVLSRYAISIEEGAGDEGDRMSAVSLPNDAADSVVLDRLRRHGFDMQATARTLGWDRSTVTQRLKGLCFQALIESHGDHAKAALAVAGDCSHLRTVELKLHDYFGHLLSVIQPFATVEDALAECARRFKNLPDRHFASVEQLVRAHFVQRPSRASLLEQ